MPLSRTLAGILLALGLAWPAFGSACEKTLRWSDDPPFSMRAANGEIHGMQIELHREILGDLGCRLRLLELPWARALAELEAGRLDILPGAFKTPERELYAHFSQPVLLSRNMLFLRQDALKRWPINRLLDLRNTDFRLGAQIGVAYGPDYDLLLQDAEFVRSIQRASSRRALWQMVALGRIDGLIADELTGLYELRQAGLDAQITMSSVVVSDTPAGTAFSKRSNDSAFVQAFNKRIEAARKDGRYQAILRRHNATP